MTAKIRGIRDTGHGEMGFVEKLRPSCQWILRFGCVRRLKDEIDRCGFLLAESKGIGSCVAVSSHLRTKGVSALANP